MVHKEGQFDVVELMVNNQLVFNARDANGMTVVCTHKRSWKMFYFGGHKL